MRLNFCFRIVASCLLSLAWGSRAAFPPSFVTETADEFLATGDFDGDGNPDVVIVDKATGKYRPGYYTTNGLYNWVDCRQSSIKGVTGFTIGHLLAQNRDALAFTSPDGSQISICDVSSPISPVRPMLVSFTAAIGPSMIVALDMTPEKAKASLMDLFVSSIYNSPDANMLTLLHNNGADFPKTFEAPLTGTVTHGNRLQLSEGHERLCYILSEDKGDSFQVQDLSSGKPVASVTMDVPKGADFSVGRFGTAKDLYVLTYKPGDSKVTATKISDSGRRIAIEKKGAFDLPGPVKRVSSFSTSEASRLFVIFGEGEKSGIFDFDGSKAPTLAQTIVSTNELITGVEVSPAGITVFSRPASSKISTRYLTFNTSGNSYSFSVFGTLPTLADNDNITIPEIYDHIVANAKVKTESEMKAYTNMIPGTDVTYAMVPIPGGEFVMGSPASEPGRKADEGPQHKVKLDPFWMQQCEITWNEYELFMYPDEEKRVRATQKTDASGDKLADAVTHPSKPYVEMSFGMGKDGFPAIAMTQHAANKYCQWLSAKTGEFYRLPTEAEWEYACRAGTTTTWFFGDDKTKLKDFAWYEDNSDFKYQKVGKKKPNPWGLYDIYGNVTEWVLDGYDADYYKTCEAQGLVVNPLNKAMKPYPLAVRGGSWDDEANLCRSAARRGSERAWKMQDPQLPKSVWYFSDAQFVGFRIVRPLKVPPPEQMQKYWSSGVERD